MPVQSKLLQFLQSKQYCRLGDTTPQVANVRIIAATNVDLKTAIAKKAFRDDLFYRLEGLPLRMPSVAERREDISDLAEHFCARACEEQKRPGLRLSHSALLAMKAVEWTGNIRELANKVEAAIARAASQGAQQVDRHHLFPDHGPESGEPRPLSYHEATRRFQKQLLEQSLDKTNWNSAMTAEELELSRAHVYNLIAGFGLERKKS
jgi:Nif-specific regulatory protein